MTCCETCGCLYSVARVAAQSNIRTTGFLGVIISREARLRVRVVGTARNPWIAEHLRRSPQKPGPSHAKLSIRHHQLSSNVTHRSRLLKFAVTRLVRSAHLGQRLPWSDLCKLQGRRS
jgi:hypothetical protein